jgi:hypothetical protein
MHPYWEGRFVMDHLSREAGDYGRQVLWDDSPGTLEHLVLERAVFTAGCLPWFLWVVVYELLETLSWLEVQGVPVARRLLFVASITRNIGSET